MTREEAIDIIKEAEPEICRVLTLIQDVSWTRLYEATALLTQTASDDASEALEKIDRHGVDIETEATELYYAINELITLDENGELEGEPEEDEEEEEAA